MSLFPHLLIHFTFALLAGLIAWLVWKKPIASFIAGIIGGFLIDMDHFIDYLIAFGPHFRWDYFSNGYQFLKTGKFYIFFHGWEYAVIFLILVFICCHSRHSTLRPESHHSDSKSESGNPVFLILKSIFLALALGIIFHLSADFLIHDGMMIKSYSIIYRAANDFDVGKIVTPEHYQGFLFKQSTINFE